MLRLAHPFIPFITEELWQKVAPLAGNERRIDLDSAAIRRPVHRRKIEALDAEAEREVTCASRSERWRCGRCAARWACPRRSALRRLPSGDKASLSATSPYVVALAKLSGLEIVDELPSHDAPVEVVGSDRLMLHIEVDLVAERARLGKDARDWNAISPRPRKSSPMRRSSVARRPTVVADERARLQANEATLNEGEDTARPPVGLRLSRTPDMCACARHPPHAMLAIHANAFRFSARSRTGTSACSSSDRACR